MLSVPKVSREQLESFELGFGRLTTREKQVAQSIVDGTSAKQTARSLGISYRTIEVHRGRVLEKLGVKSAGDLLRVALANDALAAPSVTLPAEKAPGRDIEALVSSHLTLEDLSAVPLADILAGIDYHRQPVPDAVNVFMMWDSTGGPSGFLVIPEELQAKVLRQSYPDPNVARDLPAALSYGLLLAILGKRCLHLTGDARVWDTKWGVLPTSH